MVNMNVVKTALPLFSDGTPVPVDGKFHADPLNPFRLVRCQVDPWTPPNVSKIISGGNTAYLGLLLDNSVLKFPHDRNDSFSHKALDIEHQILSEIGPHDRITRYLGRQEHGLCFELAAKGDIRSYMSTVQLDSISVHLRMRWATQAAEALAFIHSREVIHCDVHPNKFILDDALDLRLCDFAGSMYRNLDGCAMETTRFFLKRSTVYSQYKDGSLRVGIDYLLHMSGHEPYATLSDEEVTAQYSRGDFPEVDSTPCGQIILGCWKGGFDNAKEAFLALSRESKAL